MTGLSVDGTNQNHNHFLTGRNSLSTYYLTPLNLMQSSMKYESVNKALIECAAACDHCFDANFDEQAIRMMERCIRLTRDCADICRLTVSVLSRDSEVAKVLLRACADICKSCAEACKEHQAPHAQACGEACIRCMKACRAIL